MQAVVVEGTHLRQVVEVSGPTTKEDEVFVTVKAYGVCGTDLHIFEGDFPSNFPLIPGREFAGEIIEVGKSVKSIKFGDFVAVHPNVLCGLCDFCKEGFSLLVEASGNPKAVELGLKIVRSGGKFLQFGVCPNKCNCQLFAVLGLSSGSNDCWQFFPHQRNVASHCSAPFRAHLS